jgi:hypothetical protein
MGENEKAMDDINRAIEYSNSRGKTAVQVDFSLIFISITTSSFIQ